MRRLPRQWTRPLASLALLGGVTASALVRADELPMPGPVIDGPVVKLGPTQASSEGDPLWELGMGAAVVHFAHYRGSDQSRTHVLPLPFINYRGRFLRADSDGARAILFAGRRIEIDVSLSASVPTDSEDNDARRGMPNLRGTFEIGPNANIELWRSGDRRLKLDLRLPLREAITLESRSRAIGLTFSPNLNLDVSGFGGAWNLGMLAGPIFAERRHHQYFYGVSPEFATSSRPAYDAPGGYSGWRALTAISRRLGNAWLGGFIRYDDLHGAKFAPSPLVRRQTNLTAGFGISWIFATSSQRVRTDD